MDALLWLVPLAALVSAGTLAAAVVGLPFVLARMPADWFLTAEPTPLDGLGSVARNLLGVALIAAGIIMLFTPGQGLLTLFAGVLLTDLPGKRAVALALIRRNTVRSGVDWIRQRAGVEPLQLP